MKENLHLKRGLITQSLSPVFALLIIRHIHCDYPKLIQSFFNNFGSGPWDTMVKVLSHPRFGELLIVVIGLIWVVASLISIPAFKATQESRFESHGEQVIVVEEKKDAAASFLMTFILPLLIDELSSPQNWISYVLVIVMVYAVLHQSNLYYQSPVLALLGYKVFSFQVMNPYQQAGLKENKTYIGITKKHIISEDAAIMWRHIANDVFLVYNEGSN